MTSSRRRLTLCHSHSVKPVARFLLFWVANQIALLVAPLRKILSDRKDTKKRYWRYARHRATCAVYFYFVVFWRWRYRHKNTGNAHNTLSYPCYMHTACCCCATAAAAAAAVSRKVVIGFIRWLAMGYGSTLLYLGISDMISDTGTFLHRTPNQQPRKNHHRFLTAVLRPMGTK